MEFGVQLLVSDFLAESLKASKNKQKRSLVLQHSFAQNPHSFYEAQLTQHYKEYAPATQPKTLLTLRYTQIYSISQQTCFWFVSEKFLHCIISGHPKTSFWKHWESKCLYIPVYLRKKFFPFKAACCLGFVKCFKMFHFNRNL